MQHSDNISPQAPSLPKGGGALTGLSGQAGAAGPDGAASLSLPLPISAGRGYAPSLSLSYSSQGGNSAFGIGWDVNLPSISRRTRSGVPAYTAQDEFISPAGEVLITLTGSDGKPLTEKRQTLLGTTLNVAYQITTYRARVESDFSRLEYWQPQGSTTEPDFWLWYTADGQVHLLGYESAARISSGNNTARWLLNASVSATGEQIYYRYRAEDDTNCDTGEKAAHPGCHSQRYLSEVHYGNITAGRTFACLNGINAIKAGWLFVLVFDYGERTIKPDEKPLFNAGSGWLCRQDPFSGYAYGFNLRTRRLCRQVLMFHRLETLSEKANGEDEPALVSRLLLEYQETVFITTFTAARQMAFEDDGNVQSLPPLTFGWQTFEIPATPQWSLQEMGKLNPYQPWQYLDLHGEGIAGVLYQDSGAWYYRAPVRDTQSNDINAVIWNKPQRLDAIPVLKDGAILTDLDGDGRMQWVVTQPGVHGQYVQQTDDPATWLNFTPLSTLPLEYRHPGVQMTDINGIGATDLVLIGPRSVRIWLGGKDGWLSAQTIPQAEKIVLPSPDGDNATLVAFSDVLGSGQQHLVQISAGGVVCWPNLGHGRFGQPLTLDGFSKTQAEFNAGYVYLADIDGSGTADILYARSDYIEIYRNRSGNGFDKPQTVKLPAGVRYDHTCRLQVADVQGLGVASLLLTVPHTTPRHYLLHLTTEKPWLLSQVNNQMGMVQKLHYRSSAQFRLDDKTREPVSYLPFPIHTLWRTESTDEITGNKRVSEARYHHGVWDAREREFRGFGCVEVQDTDTAAARDTSGVLTMPVLTRSWYATGYAPVDKQLKTEYWQGDTAAFAGFTPRLTTGSGDNEVICSDNMQKKQVFWLTRAQKGMQLRSEVYGKDGSPQQELPYSVSEQRLTVRLITPDAAVPVIHPGVSESREYHYERMAADPQCSQSVVLSADEYGYPLREAKIHYPRRPKSGANPLPDTLPASLSESGYDGQQLQLIVSLSQHTLHHLSDLKQGQWLTGLAGSNRSDIFMLKAGQQPANGFTAETLQPLLTGSSSARIFAGQQKTYWFKTDNQSPVAVPVWPPRPAHTETAALDETIISALGAAISIKEPLQQGAYKEAGYLFADSTEQNKKVWVITSGSTTFGNAAQFWLPLRIRDNPLIGERRLTRDKHHCVITAHTDASGLVTSAKYDWRFLSVRKITDANGNISQVQTDALGRVISSRFYGTENGKSTGYSEKPLTLPDSVQSATEMKKQLPVAQCFVYAADSWMRSGTDKLPPHVLTLTTDRYDDEPADKHTQQIRQQVTFSDGFGRILQQSVRFEGGDAFHRNKNGALAAGSRKSEKGAARWAVSGRTEYDNKGNAVRTYQPYFVNDWKYVSDDSARQDLYADTHYYDPLGREHKVITAKGYQRRMLFTPWFVVSEDENDTPE